MSLTQINAYVLEICKAQKEQLKALKGPEKVIDKNTKLTDLKKLGIVIKGKHGRR